MAHIGNNQDPRGNERHPAYVGDIEKQKTKEKDPGKNLDELGRDIDVDAQTPKKAKEDVAKMLVDAKDSKLPKKDELLDQGFEALELSTFSNFEDFITEDGDLQGGASTSFTSKYLENFGKDPNYDVAIGEYDDGDYAVYLKKKNS